jgi:hypothetical protein
LRHETALAVAFVCMIVGWMSGGQGYHTVDLLGSGFGAVCFPEE